MPGYALLDSRDIVSGFYPRYEKALADGWAAQVGMAIPSDSETENYKWLGQSPDLREWKGGRHEGTLNKFNFSLTNQLYEATLMMPLAEMRRDKTGQIRIRIDDMAVKAAAHWDSLLATLIDGNGLCYDGQNFFDTDHDESGSNQVNAVTVTQIPAANVSTAANPTPDEMADILVQMVGHFYTLTDDTGAPMNGGLRSFTILVGGSPFWASAFHAVSRDNLSSGASNVVKGLQSAGLTFRVVLEPRLTVLDAADQFVLIANDGPTRPFILQEEYALQTKILGAGSDYEFHNNGHEFGIDVSRKAGFGFWQKALRVTLS